MNKIVLACLMLFSLATATVEAQHPINSKIDSLEKVIESLQKINSLKQQISVLKADKITDIELYDLRKSIKKAKTGIGIGAGMTALGALLLLAGSGHDDIISTSFFTTNGVIFAIPGTIILLANGERLSKLKKKEAARLKLNSGPNGVGFSLNLN